MIDTKKYDVRYALYRKLRDRKLDDQMANLPSLEYLRASASRFCSTVHLFDHIQTLIGEASANMHSIYMKMIPDQTNQYSFDYIDTLKGELFPLKEQLDEYTDWQQDAARSGAVTIYNFGKSLKYLAQELEPIDALLGTTTEADVKIVFAKFEGKFPGWKKLRDAATHSTEFAYEKRHRSKGPVVLSGKDMQGSGHLVLDDLAGRTYTSFYGGDPFSYDISEDTADLLESYLLECVERLAGAFA